MQPPGTNRTTEISPASVSLRALLHIGFILTGVVTTLLGPILPFLAARWSLSDSQAGLFFSAQFLGSLIGGLSTSILIPRRGYSFTLLVGFGFMAAGVGALGLGPWALGMISVFCYGIGLGLTIPATNLWVAEAAPHRRAAALSILNLSWSIGAIACPPLVDLFKSHIGIRSFGPGLAVALCLLAASFALRCIAKSGRASPPVEPPRLYRTTLWKNLAAVTLGTLFFLYVGTENALGGWVAFYAKRVSADPGSIWLFTPSFFWGALLVGRALAPIALRFVAEKPIVVTGLLLASGGTVRLLTAGTLAAVLVGASVAGLGLAPIFPILVSWLKQELGAAATRAGGAMFAMGSLGGATLPWLVGFVSTHVGTLRVGLLVPLLSIFALIAFQLGAFRANSDDSFSRPPTNA